MLPFSTKACQICPFRGQASVSPLSTSMNWGLGNVVLPAVPQFMSCSCHLDEPLFESALRMQYQLKIQSATGRIEESIYIYLHIQGCVWIYKVSCILLTCLSLFHRMLFPALLWKLVAARVFFRAESSQPMCRNEPSQNYRCSKTVGSPWPMGYQHHNLESRLTALCLSFLQLHPLESVMAGSVSKVASTSLQETSCRKPSSKSTSIFYHILAQLKTSDVLWCNLITLHHYNWNL